VTYELVDTEKANYPTRALCRSLGVSTSSFYEWRHRRADPSPRARGDAALTERIRKIHVQSRGTYGAPRIHAELRLGEGIRVGRKRVARLMRSAGIEGVYRRRRRGCTRRDPTAELAQDLVNRRFDVDGPNELWVSDVERHEALLDRAEVTGLRPRAIAAAREKLGAA